MPNIIHIHHRYELLIAVVMALAIVTGFSVGAAYADGGPHEVDAVTDVKTDTKQDGQYSDIAFTATWAAPEQTHSGDYFIITLPSEFSNLDTSTSFTLDGTVGGKAVSFATCVATPKTVTCTFNDAVDKYGNVHGDLKLYVRADNANNGDKGHWDVNGKTIPGDVPDINPYVPGPMPGPDAFSKDGWQVSEDGTGVINWSVTIGADKFLYNGAPVTLTDTMDPRLALYSDDPSTCDFITSVTFSDKAQWDAGKSTYMKHGTDFECKVEGDSKFTLTFNPDSPTVKTAVEQAEKKDFTLGIDYLTRPLKPEDGVAYTNDIAGDGGQDAHGSETWQSAGGSATGQGASVKLFKDDAVSHAALKGARFDLIAGPDGKGAVLQSGLTTDASGIISVDSLYKGTYSFVETSAPQGYKKVNPRNFTISEETFDQNAAISLDIKDPRVSGSVSWSKVDSADTSRLLAGSQWALTGPNGAERVVDNGENDTDAVSGSLDVGNLAWGKYTLTEIKAPQGYQLPTGHVDFTVDATHTTIALPAITNTKTPNAPTTPIPPAQANARHLASTGSAITPIALGALALIILAAAIIIARRLRQTK